MLRKLKISYKVKIFAISSLAFILMTIGWVYLFQEEGNYRNSVIDSFGQNQELIVAQASSQISKILAASITDDQSKQYNTALNQYLKNLKTTSNQYWFLYSEKDVIFEKNEKETKLLSEVPVNELGKSWRLLGGEGVTAFEDLIKNNNSGTLVFSKNANDGQEIVSIKCFGVLNDYYYLGTSTKVDYVYSSARTNEHVIYLYSFYGLICINLIMLVLYMCINIYKNSIEIKALRKSVADKSIKIEELSRKVASHSEVAQNASIYDSITKLYNRKFFENLLMRIKHELLLPASILIIDINGLGNLNAINGYSSGDEILVKTAAILNKVTIDTDVVARTGSSEFTILMTGTEEEKAYVTLENIKRQFENLDTSELSMSVGIAEMHANEHDIFYVVDVAKKHLILDKMLDKNSSSNNIIAMLMETLKAYSGETVDHSGRLCDLSIKFGKLLGMKRSEISRLAIAAQLHDVGKIGIPESILNKKGKLEEFEINLVRRHSEIGFKIVKAIPVLDEVAIDILQHHESYDGSGYPRGLFGEEISINARIINIIDSFDAMTNASVYAKAKTLEETLIELEKGKGHKYDPRLVDDFIDLIEGEYFDDEDEKQINDELR